MCSCSCPADCPGCDLNLKLSANCTPADGVVWPASFTVNLTAQQGRSACFGTATGSAQVKVGAGRPGASITARATNPTFVCDGQGQVQLSYRVASTLNRVKPGPDLDVSVRAGQPVSCVFADTDTDVKTGGMCCVLRKVLPWVLSAGHCSQQLASCIRNLLVTEAFCICSQCPK